MTKGAELSCPPSHSHVSRLVNRLQYSLSDAEILDWRYSQSLIIEQFYPLEHRGRLAIECG